MNQSPRGECRPKAVLWTDVLRGMLVWSLALAGWALIPAAVSAQTGGPLRVVMDDNYPPYIFRTAEGKLQGILIDQWQEWEKATGTKVEIQAMDWGEAVRRMKEGEFDVIDTIFDTHERREYLDFTAPYVSLDVPIFFRKEISGIANLESLRGFPVAAKEGDDAAELLRKSGVKTVVLFRNYEAIMAAAAENKVRIFVVDAPPALYYLNKLGLQDKFRRTAPVNVGKFHRAVRKGDIVLLREVEAGFAVVGQHKIKQINEKWLGQPLINRRGVALAGYVAAGALVLAVLLFGWNRTLTRRVRLRTTALSESEDRFRRAIESDLIGILFWDHAGAITGANDVFLRIVGYSREDLASGKLQWRKMTPPEFQSLDEAALQEVATKGACEHYEKEFLRKDGSRVPIVIGGASFGGSSGEGVAFVLDITARKQAEAVGAVRARQHAVVAELGRLALTDVTLQRLLDRAVAQVADAFGVEYCKVLELQPSGEELKLVAGVGWQEGLVGRATVGAGLDSQAGFTLISRDPIVVDDLRTDSRFNGPALLTDHGVVSGLSVIIGEVERPFGVLGVHTRRHRTFAPEDLDFLQSVGNLLAESVQRKKMESSLRRSEERYREIVNQSPTGILVHIDGLVVFVNEAYCHLVGASSAEELLGTAVLERFNSEYHTAIRDRIENIVRTDETTPPMDSELVRIDGSLLDVTTAGTLINFQGALAVQVMVQDVTDRKRAERALRKSEQRFREVAESIDDVIWIRELDDPAAFYHSPAFEKVWGRSSASVRAVRDSWLNTIHPDDRTALRHAAEVKQERGDYDETYRIMRPDGAMRWIHDRAYPVRDAAGKVVRIVGIAKDITARRKLEEQLRQSQKMEAVGQLAGGVAHDFNNMLTVIIGHLALLRADPQVTPKTANALAEVATAANRAAKLTSQLLTFSRRQVMTTSTLDLNKVVTDLMPMLRRMLGEAVELQFDSAAEALAFNGDVNLMEQVLVNLAINARDAMPGGGTLRITAQGLTRVPPATDGSEPATGPANFVRLSVGDTGAGIPEEIRSKIFEPFFTTKDVGKGTGLGLATVFGIVQQHRGWIELESELGRGSTFHVYLPRLAIAAATKTTEPSARPAKGGSEVVLLVEDEPMVQEICMLALTQFGYQVFAASNGMEALKVWAQHEDEIDLLLTDMVMPNGISGTQLARRMLAEKPALKVIYSSGYSAEIAGKDVSLKEGLNFLSKPFELDRLLRTVRATLDGKSSRDPFVEKD